MPETSAEFTGYAYAYQNDPATMLQEVPEQRRSEVRDLVEEIASDPDRYSIRTKSLSNDAAGETVVYTHRDNVLEITYRIDRRNRKLTFLHFACRVVELKQLFISYSHADAKWRDLVQTYLASLNNVCVWNDTQIQPGAEWHKEIENALLSAQAAVFLVTQTFLTSQFIQAEEIPSMLTRARDNAGVKILWIAVGSSTVMDSVLGRYQALNDPKRPLELLSKAKRNQAMLEIYENIKKEIVSPAAQGVRAMSR